MSVKDMTRQKIGLVEVIERAGSDAYGNARWRCKCKCGNEFIAKGHDLRNGHVRSCGHLQRQIASELNATHRMSKTRLYAVWDGMKQRCENPNSTAYRDYGAKGVRVCQEWHDFERFYEWMMSQGYKPGLTIDRKDNAKGYGPDNCRLATRAEQNRNTSRTHRIICGSEIVTAAEAARMVGSDRSTVAKWVRDGRANTIADVFALAKNQKRRERK